MSEKQIGVRVEMRARSAEEAAEDRALWMKSAFACAAVNRDRSKSMSSEEMRNPKPRREPILICLDCGKESLQCRCSEYGSGDVEQESVIAALVAAYHNAARQLLTSEDLEAGHRAGVRDVAVRLGVYDRFTEALNKSN